MKCIAVSKNTFIYLHHIYIYLLNLKKSRIRRKFSPGEISFAGRRFARPGGRRSRQTIRDGVDRASEGRSGSGGSASRQAGAGGGRGLHGAARLQRLHGADRVHVCLQLPLRSSVHRLPILRLRLLRALLRPLETTCTFSTRNTRRLRHDPRQLSFSISESFRSRTHEFKWAGGDAPGSTSVSSSSRAF